MDSISQVIHDCETCAAIKQAKRVKPLWYGGRWSKYKYGEAWQIDYITLPQTRQGKRYVLTMVEATPGWLETYPVPHATARNTILGLEKQVLWRHGTPERIESDNGTHFKNSLINTWAREHGIEWVYHIPYHAPAARKVERCNGLLKTTLKALGEGTLKNWENNLAKATWLVNTRGSTNRAGPAQSEPLRTRDGDKVPVVHMRVQASIQIPKATSQKETKMMVIESQEPEHENSKEIDEKFQNVEKFIFKKKRSSHGREDPPRHQKGPPSTRASIKDGTALNSIDQGPLHPEFFKLFLRGVELVNRPPLCCKPSTDHQGEATGHGQKPREGKDGGASRIGHMRSWVHLHVHSHGTKVVTIQMVKMEPVSVRTLPLRNPHLILEACLLISLSVLTIGWLIPQPKANVWATLARAMGQDHTCLSATSAGNPLTTCLVGIPFQPEEFPSKLLEMQTPVNCEGISEGQTVSWNSPPKSFVGVKINLPVKNPLILWQKGQERFFQAMYQSKGVYTASRWCDRIAHVKLGLFSPNKTTLMDWERKESTQLVIRKRDLAALDANCDSKIIHWSKSKGVAITVFLPWVLIAKALGELAHLECWVAKQANLTSNALTNLLSDEEVTRQATLQNGAAIDYLLLLHSHRCEEFEGLCCFNLSSRAENIYDAIQEIREMVGSIKKETDNRLGGLFANWGISDWAGSILKNVLLTLFILVLVLVSLGLIKQMVCKLILSTTHSPTANHVIVPTAPEMEEGMELEGDSEEDGDPEGEEGCHQEEWATHQQWFTDLYQDSKNLPPPFQFSSS
ncbi:hypothetical protein DUI87_33662 [Hirundo rustica rustica]|uniref:Integrase catalytic domain-containing protein n=1 Tax=Hirundo rustica rustica TaxID=333673 RepID=A0A3M0ISX7_HIRRU|nr:hypothetical protein DUI87_33662 [Hirundo rustica rustica]